MADTTHHRIRILIGRVHLPLRHNHAGLAGNRAVHAVLARLVGAHGEAAVLLARDVNKVAVVGQAARGSALLDTRVLGVQLLDLGGELGVPREVGVGVPPVAMAVGGSLAAEQHQGRNRVGESHRGECAFDGISR